MAPSALAYGVLLKTPRASTTTSIGYVPVDSQGQSTSSMSPALAGQPVLRAFLFDTTLPRSTQDIRRKPHIVADATSSTLE
ncbi:MAG: hypothetical protein M1831_007285 [Alyxoria varia]|nr:MAG: hypothetical protein M1831_007285 [Alyxoria varia]